MSRNTGIVSIVWAFVFLVLVLVAVERFTYPESQVARRVARVEAARVRLEACQGERKVNPALTCLTERAVYQELLRTGGR